jgi:hypothetical protein
MRTLMLCGGLLVLAAGGCASTSTLEARARDHEMSADRYAADRNYAAAAQEQTKADDLRRRANERASQQPTVTPPVAPPAVPMIPPPLDPTIP